MKHFFLALRFLTILPLGQDRGEIKEEDLVASMYYYPLVGALLGMIIFLFFNWARGIWPLFLSSALTVTLWVLLTAGLHLDGLMDTFDGLGVRGDSERRLAVMRDSRVGAFGAQAACLLIFLKIAAIAALSSELSMPGALFLAPVAGRTAMVALMGTSSYARSESGLGRIFVEGAGISHVVVTAILFIVLAGAYLWATVFAALVSQIIVFLAIRYFFRVNFGGITGDLVGAAGEIHELALLIVIAAVA